MGSDHLATSCLIYIYRQQDDDDDDYLTNSDSDSEPQVTLLLAKRYAFYNAHSNFCCFPYFAMKSVRTIVVVDSDSSSENGTMVCVFNHISLDLS